MVNLRTAVSIKGTAKENEDRFGIKGNYFWVIDGATDLFNCQEDIGYSVSECMEMLSTELYTVCGTQGSLIEDLKYALARLNRYMFGPRILTNKEYAKSPTYSMVYGVINGSRIDYILIGDCYLIVDNQVITDTRISEFAKANRKKVEKLLSEVDKTELEKARKEVFQATRLKANAEDGYPIGSLCVTSVDNVIQGSLQFKGNLKVMTDGFYKFYKEGCSTGDVLRELYSVAIDEVYGKRDDATVLELGV
jgi:hypothetical protein